MDYAVGSLGQVAWVRRVSPPLRMEIGGVCEGACHDPIETYQELHVKPLERFKEKRVASDW